MAGKEIELIADFKLRALSSIYLWGQGKKAPSGWLIRKIVTWPHPGGDVSFELKNKIFIKLQVLTKEYYLNTLLFSDFS